MSCQSPITKSSSMAGICFRPAARSFAAKAWAERFLASSFLFAPIAHLATSRPTMRDRATAKIQITVTGFIVVLLSFKRAAHAADEFKWVRNETDGLATRAFPA